MQLQQTFTSRLTLVQSHGSNVIPLEMPSPLKLPIYQACEAWTIQNFKAYSRITSVDEAELPRYELEDSDTDKLYKSLDVEWMSPRKQLNLYVGNVNDWTLIGSVSLLNPAGYPYRIYNLLNLYSDATEGYIGTNVKLAVSVNNVGYGLLDADDRLDVHLNIIRTVSCIPNIGGA